MGTKEDRRREGCCIVDSQEQALVKEFPSQWGILKKTEISGHFCGKFLFFF